jgi:hypothetical protein
MNPAQIAPLTRSPRDDDGDDGDGADSSAWLEDKKQLGAMSSWARAFRRLNRYRRASARVISRKLGGTDVSFSPDEEIFTANDVFRLTWISRMGNVLLQRQFQI